MPRLQKSYYLLPNVIKKENCLALIKRFEIEGTLAQELEIFDYRSGRYDFENCELTRELFRRIKEVFKIHGAFETEETVKVVNDRWYVSKYWPVSSHISEHADGNVKIGDEESNYSVLLYLNDDFEGGETVIEDGTLTEAGFSLLHGTSIKPKTGSVLLLRQDVFHEVKACYKGFKYILRGDAIIN